MSTRHPELGSGVTYTPTALSIVHFGTPPPKPTPQFTILDEHGIEVKA